MFCHKCGNSLPEGAIYCNKCGVSVIATEATMVIPRPILTPTPSSVPLPRNTEKLPTEVLNRFLNYVCDRFLGGIITVLFFVIIWGFFSILGSSGFIEQDGLVLNIVNFIFPILMASAWFGNPLYYLVFEWSKGRTIGKWITKTKVVRRDGDKPKFLQILGRSFARLIPFEPFSFLFSSYPVGWHDSLSKTVVVPEEYSKEDVLNINYAHARKQHTNLAGLIVAIIAGVLMFIAIIGILASIVLASLNEAREKAKEAKLKVDSTYYNPENKYQDSW